MTNRSGSRRRRERTRAILRPGLCFALAAAVLLAGCGFGAGDERGGAGARLTVTRDFGHRQVATTTVAKVREDQTVMRLLQSKLDVKTSQGGRFVEGIEGLRGAGADGQRDWFYWVNGVEAGVGAADYELDPGDRVQWDFRDWRATMRVPAIVGAFPEPLQDGWEGKRQPVRVECERAGSAACKEVQDRLHAVNVPVSGASIGAPGTENVIRVLVGRWPVLRQSVDELEDGPQQSGVFARFAHDGRSLDLLDAAGKTARTVRAGDGVGLVAALFPREDQLAWVVTGLDDDGVDAAAQTLTAKDLRDAFAVAVTAGRVQKLPLEEG